MLNLRDRSSLDGVTNDFRRRAVRLAAEIFIARSHTGLCRSEAMAETDMAKGCVTGSEALP